MRRLLVCLLAVSITLLFIGCDSAGPAPETQEKRPPTERAQKPDVVETSTTAKGYDFGLTNDKEFTRSEDPIEKGDLNGNGTADYVTGFHLSGEVGIYYDRKPEGTPDEFIRIGADAFGFAFEIFNGDLVVGAPFEGGGKAFVIDSSGNKKQTLSCSRCENFGFSVSAGGGKLAVGAPGNVFGDGAGNVMLYNGEYDRTLTLTSNRRYTKLGVRTGFIGDRLVVSSKFYPGPGPESEKGAVWIVPTGATGEKFVESVHLTKFTGSGQGDELSAFAVGDFNSDGRQDLALGSRSFNYEDFRSNMGKVYVTFAPFKSGSAESVADVEIAPYKKSGKETSKLATGRFGQSLSAADGNLLIGAHGQEDGRAFLVSNFSSDLTWDGFDKEFRPTGERHRHFGRAVAAFGDMFVVGDPAYSGNDRYGSLSVFNR